MTKYSKKLLNRAHQFAPAEHKATSKRAIQQTTEATSDLNGNKIADKFTKVAKRSPQSSPKTVERETENIVFDRKKTSVCQAIHQTNHQNYGTKIGLKHVMIHAERITQLVKLNLKHQC